MEVTEIVREDGCHNGKTYGSDRYCERCNEHGAIVRRHVDVTKLAEQRAKNQILWRTTILRPLRTRDYGQTKTTHMVMSPRVLR